MSWERGTLMEAHELLDILLDLEGNGRAFVGAYRYPYSQQICPSCGASLIKSECDLNKDRSKHYESCKLRRAIVRLEEAQKRQWCSLA